MAGIGKHHRPQHSVGTMHGQHGNGVIDRTEQQVLLAQHGDIGLAVRPAVHGEVGVSLSA